MRAQRFFKVPLALPVRAFHRLLAAMETCAREGAKRRSGEAGVTLADRVTVNKLRYRTGFQLRPIYERSGECYIIQILFGNVIYSSVSQKHTRAHVSVARFAIRVTLGNSTLLGIW